MSQETMTTLNQQTLIGFTESRGNAWHYRESDQGEESNHYPKAIPVADVERRLFNWEVLEAEATWTAHVVNEDGVEERTYADPSRKGLMRSDTGAILGVFKQGYRVHQYKDTLLRRAEDILDDDIRVGSAGLLVGGARAWVQVELEETQTVGDFAYRPFLTLATSCDGSLSTTFLTGAQAVVCDNTLSAALGSSATSYKIKHSSQSLMRLSDARQALQLITAVDAAFQAQVEALLSEKVTDKQYDTFLNAYLEITPEKEKEGGRAATIAGAKKDQLWDLWTKDERVEPWAHTAFGVVQAVNTFDHHLLNIRQDRVERNMDRVITGGFDKLDANTLTVLRGVLA